MKIVKAGRHFEEVVQGFRKQKVWALKTVDSLVRFWMSRLNTSKICGCLSYIVNGMEDPLKRTVELYQVEANKEYHCSQ